MKSKYLNFFVYAVILFIFAGYGFLVSEKKLPPYYLLKSINQQLSSLNNADKLVLKEIAQDQNINYVETTLIPLEYFEINLGNPISETSTSSGALNVFGNRVFVINKHREVVIFNLDTSEAKYYSLGDLNDNNESFFDKSKKNLRIHDILIKNINNLSYILVSHEKYYPEVDKHSLNISYKRLEDDFSFSNEGWKLLYQGTQIKYPDYAYSSGGGQLANLDQDTLLMANGDYNIDNWVNMTDEIPPSQDINSSIGKVLKINFSNKKSKLISLGHRNPQGLFVSSSGIVFQSEHGPNGGDEINTIDLNNVTNYGWPYQSLGVQYIDFNAPVEGNIGSHNGYEMPIYAFVPSIGISEIIQLENFDMRWDGDILVGSLKSRTLYRLRIDDDKVIYSEPIWIGERIRDIKQLNNNILVWLDNQNLRIYTISERLLNSMGREANQTELHALLSSCLQCHHIGATNPNHPAPSLSGLFDRKIGMDPEYKYYSSAIKQYDSYWTKNKLKKYIINPQSVILVTSMPAASNIYTDSELDEIVQLLENYSTNSIN